MSYVDAAYTIVLVVVVLYGAGLLLRRRRLSRAASVAARDASPDAPQAPAELPATR